MNEALTDFSTNFMDGIDRMSRESNVPNFSAAVAAEFRAAELSAMHFIRAPDSTHVRTSKQYISAAKLLLSSYAAVSEDASAETVQRHENLEERTLDPPSANGWQSCSAFSFLFPVLFARKVHSHSRLPPAHWTVCIC